MVRDSTEWLGGSAQAVAESLVDFTKSSRFLSEASGLIQKYDQKWVGVHAGEVRAAEDNLGACAVGNRESENSISPRISFLI